MGNYLILKKLQEGKLFMFCSPKRRAENEMKGNEMFIASTKIHVFEGSISPSNFHARLLVTRISLVYLVDEFFLIFSFPM